MSQEKSIVTLLLDRSYSMLNIKTETVIAINAWISELRKAKVDMRFSLVQFDSSPQTSAVATGHPNAMPAGLALGSAGLPGLGLRPSAGVFPASPAVMQLEKTIDMRRVAEVDDLSADDFQPRGGTPLIDAAVTTIRAIEETVQGREDIKVVLAIQTDGDENTSVRYVWEDLRRLVAEKEALGWEILFMGAGIDAYHQGAKMGVSRDKTLSYGVDAAATRSAFATTAGKTVLYASGAVENMAYSFDEKRAAGDLGG